MLKRRKLARIYIFFWFIMLFVSLKIPVLAAPSVSYYNTLKEIHRGTPTYDYDFNPRKATYDYDGYCKNIDQVKTLSGEPEKNSESQWVNPWIYNDYDNLVVYGKPHGAFYENPNGRMKKEGTTNVYGEYQFLGYDYLNVSVTNDRYYNPNSSGGVFNTANDYKNTNWQMLKTTERNSWRDLDDTQKEYLLNSSFYDDDYTGTPANRPPTTLATFLVGRNIPDYAYVQVPPKILVGGSVRLDFYKKNGNFSWNTLIYDPMYPDTKITGAIETDKGEYTIPTGADSVTVSVTLKGTISGNIVPSRLSLLKNVTFDFNKESVSVDVIPPNAQYTVTFTKTFTRGELNTGENIKELVGIITLNTVYSNDNPLVDTVKKNIKIHVMDDPDPYVNCKLTVNPDLLLYKGSDMSATLTAEYELVNWVDTTKIANVMVNFVGESVSLESATIKGSKEKTVQIPRSYMDDVEEGGNKVKRYALEVTYNFKDGTTKEGKAAATINIVTSNPPPDNNAPKVSLMVPACVKAGEEFGAVLSAYDPDDDPLECDIIPIAANISFVASNNRHKILWYSKEYAGQTMQIIGTATDGQFGASDIKFVEVLDPIVNAQMNISGSLKVNRKVTISDFSNTPKHYPITNRTWNIYPVPESGTTSADIKYSGTLTGTEKDVLFKKAGKYRIVLSVTNAAGYTSTTERIIEIQPDLKPIANFDGASIIYRDPMNSNKATFELFNTSYSNDGDSISNLKIYYRFDSNNDGIFDDHSWTQSYNGANKDKHSIVFNSVGRYQIRLVVKEEFGQPTISNFITDTDYLTDEKILTIEVDNLAPSIDLSLQQSKKTLDIGFIIDKANSNYTVEQIESRVNSIVKPLLQSNFDLNLNIKYLDYYWDKYTAKMCYDDSELIKTDYPMWYVPAGKEYPYRVWVGYGYTFSRENGFTLTNTYNLPALNDYWGSPDYQFYVLENGNTTGSPKIYKPLSHAGGGNWVCVYSLEAKTVYEKDSLVSSKLKSNTDMYPQNGKHTDGYYYEGNSFTQNLNKNISESTFFNTNNDKILVLIKNNSIDMTKSEELISTLLSNEIYFYGLGRSANKTNINSIITANDNKGYYFDNTTIDTALTQMANNIISSLVKSIIPSEYVVVGEKIKLEKTFSDYENDPLNQIKFIYTHDPSYFENSMGMDANAGKELSTLDILPTSKVGKYVITSVAQDRPSTNTQFTNYYKWSEPASKIVYVHRKPIPVPVVKLTKSGTKYNVNQYSQSYDPDHASLPNKGIIETKWYYRETSSTSWISGTLPSSLSLNKDYLVKIEVTDMEYTTSTKVIQVSTSATNNRPVAQFAINKNPIKTDYNLIYGTDLVDQSFDPDGDTITQYKWTVTKNGTKVNSGDTIKLSYSDTGSGEYIITLEVKDSLGAWSVPYSQKLIVSADIIPPTITMSPMTRDWANSNMSVTIMASDTGGSTGAIKVLYAWSKNPSNPDTAYTTTNTTANVTVTQSAEGIWYLFAQAVDSSGNTSAVVRGGPYKIDKTAPVNEEVRITGEKYKNGNTYWTNANGTMTIYQRGREDLSGLRYSRISKTDGDANTAYHDWNSSSTHLTVSDTSLDTAIISAAEQIENNGVYEVAFTVRGLRDSVSNVSVQYTDIATNTTEWIPTGHRIGVDTLPPVVTVTPESRGLSRFDAVATVSLSDSGSGIARTRYMVTAASAYPSSGFWETQYGESFNVTITQSGSWYIHVESFDNVGNKYYGVYGPYRVDNEGPRIAIFPENCAWRNTPIAPTISVVEDMSVYTGMRYAVTDSELKPDYLINQTTLTSIDVPITEDGQWYIHAEAEDSMGNVSYAVRGPYRIDTVGPDIVFTPYTKALAGNEAINGQIPVNIQISTQGAPLASAFYRLTSIDGSIIKPDVPMGQNAAVVINEQGRWKLTVTATDSAGNTSTEQSGEYLIMPNRPPEVYLSGTSPAYLYEGDNLSIYFSVSDPDLDVLTCQISIIQGETTVWTGSTVISPSGGTYPLQCQPTMQNIQAGNYTVQATAIDPYGMTDTATMSFTVNTLGIVGAVSHTPQWEINRQKFNAAAIAAGRVNAVHGPEDFFAGEKYILHANTTLIAAGSTVNPAIVRVSILGTGFSTILAQSGQNIFSGELWDSSMIKWDDRTVDFLFEVTYNNGTVKNHTVRTYIKDDEYWRLRMQF